MKRLTTLLVTIAAVVALGTIARPDSGDVPASAPVYNPKDLPAGPLGDSIARGRLLIMDTRKLLKNNVTARMNCSACHIDGGLKDRGGSFVGVYSRFPQWNARSHRIISLQDRIAECFLYSMNGRPPDYFGQDMIAIVSYVAWLSRGTPELSTPRPSTQFKEPLPSASPDLAKGEKIYAQQCSACHQSDGNGIGEAIPPLWGAQSFNSGAGMAHIDRMTGFVHYNMPQTAPGTLSIEEAYDVSAWVLTHERPAFNGGALVTESPEPAADF